MRKAGKQEYRRSILQSAAARQSPPGFLLSCLPEINLGGDHMHRKLMGAPKKIRPHREDLEFLHYGPARKPDVEEEILNHRATEDAEKESSALKSQMAINSRYLCDSAV